MRPGRDTIAAIATPPGQGAVAIVRLSGPGALGIVEGVFRNASGTGIVESRRVYVGRLLERPEGGPIDEVLVFAMLAPRSYTGEDVVEIQCHGGSVVSRRVLESVLAAGARAAEPGEFTKRAFLNGRLDLAQAEAVADLIAARSEAGRRLAWSQLDGQLSARVGELRAAILDARALCEAAIDFPEDDVPELADGVIRQELARVRAALGQMIAGFERARVRYEGARAALVGKPNVGKSRLFNALLGRERAIVTPIAGTTRDVIEATLALAGGPVVVADTAGIRDDGDSVELLGVDRSRTAISDAACAIAVFDRSHPLNADDRVVAAAVRGRQVVAALNKADLPARARPGEVAALLGGARVVEVSALSGAGLCELASVLSQELFGSPALETGSEEVGIFRVRHCEAARSAAEELTRAEAALDLGGPPELIASDLAAAAAALGTITGEVTAEDVLDRVFAEFCIGK